MSAVKFVVTLDNGGYTWYLRRTTWTSEFDRADQFDTKVQAQIALDSAKKFMKASMAKKAVILPAPDEVR